MGVRNMANLEPIYLTGDNFQGNELVEVGEHTAWMTSLREGKELVLVEAESLLSITPTKSVARFQT